MTEFVLFHYAKAFFEIAQNDQKQKEYLNDLIFIKSVLDKNSQFILFLDSPIVDNSDKVTALEKIFSKSLSPATYIFLVILTRKKLLNGFNSIVEHYQRLLEEEQGIYRGKIHTPFMISPEKVKLIEKAISDELNSQILLDVVIDKSVIGGVKIFVKDKVFDYSLSSKLETIQTVLMKKGVK